MKQLNKTEIKELNLQIDNIEDAVEAIKGEIQKSWDGNSVSPEYVKEKVDRLEYYLENMDDILKYGKQGYIFK